MPKPPVKLRATSEQLERLVGDAVKRFPGTDTHTFTTGNYISAVGAEFDARITEAEAAAHLEQVQFVESIGVHLWRREA